MYLCVYIHIYVCMYVYICVYRCIDGGGGGAEQLSWRGHSGPGLYTILQLPV